VSTKKTWIIDVCATCARLAQWPFCEHRDQWAKQGDGTGSWYVAVRVTGNWPPSPEEGDSDS
jgi:hypothetical protein